MRISRLVLHEIACFDHLDLSFPRGRKQDKADVHVLVGENGTGKSTLLRAIAQLFTDRDIGLYRRMWGDGSQVEIFHSETGPARLVAAPGRLIHVVNSVATGPLDVGTPPSFAAFAYSGLRSVSAARVAGVVEQTDDPLRYAGDFERKGPDGFVQWVVNTRARAAFANERGDASDALRQRDLLQKLEDALGAVTGTPVALEVVDRPEFEVRLRWQARSVPVDVLPDGLKSILSWLGDLMMRMDRLPWQGDLPVTERSFALLLDEIEVHLHPTWQRKVLPMVQELFPKAQIFVATHSPFVVASADDAWIHVLKLDEQGRGYALDPLESRIGQSYETVLRDVFGVSEQFDVDTEERLRAFYELRDRTLRGEASLDELERQGAALATRSVEVHSIVQHEIAAARRRLTRRVAAS